MGQNIWKNEYNPFQKFKVLAWHDRMRSIANLHYQAPVNIALDICQGSNSKKKCGAFHCDFCMSDFEDNGVSADIPYDIILKLPQFYAEWGVKSLCLAGHHSDPTMYNHDVLIDFLERCKTYNIEIGFVSNGAYFSDKLLEACARTCKWIGFSINAGRAEDHEAITGTQTFARIIENIQKASAYIKQNNLKCTLGYKYLITDNNYTGIYDGIKLASQIGIRHIQIRPCELSETRRKAIDVQSVEEQIQRGMNEFEQVGVFEVFGVREKFNPDFSKREVQRCIASPLGSTWMADGRIVICPDRRWSAHEEDMSLGNFIEEGLDAIKEKWNGEAHTRMINAANARLGECIRCTSIHWHELYENTVENDNLDMSLI